MREWLAQPAGTSVLAFLTTFHCALALLRNHRSTGTAKLMVIPAVVLAAMPWFLPSTLWLLIGVAAQLAWFLACERLVPLPARPPTAAAASPPVPAPRRQGFRPLAVLAVIEETPEIRTFRVERPHGFTFRAGQFLMVRVVIDGAPVVRCYSITSAPATTGYLEISVRCQGTVSRHLHETLRAGMTLEVSGPGGAFVYPEGEKPIVLLAGGIGITPLLSMLRYGLASEPSRAITLVLSAKTRKHVPFFDELRVLARRHPRFRLAITLSAETPGPPFLSGRIDGALLGRVIADPKSCVFLICGPLPMIDEMRRVLETLGVPDAQVHFEKFEAATSMAASSAAGARITLRKSNRTMTAAVGQTILEAVEAGGGSIASMCRVGVCATCRTRLVSGSVDGDFEALEAADRGAGFILPCVARPLEDCVLEA